MYTTKRRNTIGAGKRDTDAQPGAGHSARFPISGVNPIASLGIGLEITAHIDPYSSPCFLFLAAKFRFHFTAPALDTFQEWLLNGTVPGQI